MTSTQTATQPGALDDAGLRRVVVVLSTVQIVSWGCLYYAFAALQSSVIAETGWSGVAVTGAFSLAQVVSAVAGLWVGRHIDAHGPRAVMTFASLLAVPGLLGVALAPTLPWFYAGWVLVGAAMAGTLYPPAFAALTRWGGSRRIGALTTLTLVAGLASTVFAPLASVLDDLVGWRLAYMLLLGGLVVITAPLHWWGLNEPWEQSSGTRREPYGSTAQTAGAVTRSRAFRCLMVANTLTALAVFAVVINLVPMLVEQGMSRDRAAMALGLGGLGQVAGRLGYARFARSTTLVVRAVLVGACVAVATAALALAPATDGWLVTVGMLLGLARGIYTLVQATAITDRWSSASYGKLNGVLTAPALFAAAAAPFVGAGLADLLGSHAHAFLLLAGTSAVAAVLMLWSIPAPADPSLPA
ncbi:MFS transporter [Nocardioides psychrotolerans]|uniref:Cyanate permease n=1 Tax=Nocardioides psychrotolerans TaxID=1005945 RepID=A0A1I3KEJ7_9ACTN|nr:MFS transporter [Nocardioides psychrotolerans]GEP38443.1 MFS transporter [Nocardioides psychrotolerans]SFI70760.1 Cyanate permease [Nocardioides psychrotolerans]